MTSLFEALVELKLEQQQKGALLSTNEENEIGNNDGDGDGDGDEDGNEPCRV